jgi:signal peptidase I
MENTISRGDHIVVDLKHFRNSHPQMGDLVIVQKDGLQIVKRVIGIGESSVEGKDGKVYVDGKALEEPYVVHTGNPPPQLTLFGPIHVPKGKLFLMGDNRDVSYDSRMPEFGLVDQSTIVGKPLYIYRSDKDRTGTYVH